MDFIPDAYNSFISVPNDLDRLFSNAIDFVIATKFFESQQNNSGGIDANGLLLMSPKCIAKTTQNPLSVITMVLDRLVGLGYARKINNRYSFTDKSKSMLVVKRERARKEWKRLCQKIIH